MIPYPGESLTVRTAVDVGGAGGDLLNSIRYRAGSATLVGGSEWTAWVSSGWADYLENDSTPLDVAWVVEVLSGSVTVTVSEGITASRGGADPTPTALGTHTLTAGTNVIPSAFTATDILYAASNLMVRIVGASGSAVVQQVKLRAWPTTGVEGGWTDPLPAFTRNVAADAYLSNGRSFDEVRGGPPGTVATLWDEVQAASHAHAGETTTESPASNPIVRSGVTATTSAVEGDVLDSSAAWHIGTGYSIATRPASIAPVVDDTLPLVEGVDYIRPPDEVFGDNDHYLQPLGTVGISWDASTAIMQTDHPDDAGGLMRVEVAPFTGDVSLVTLAWPDATASITGGALSLPDTPAVIFAATHSWILENVDLRLGDFTDAWSFVVGNGLYDFADPSAPGFTSLHYIAAYPAYRLWSPTTVKKQPLRLMQRGDGLGMGSGRVFGVGTRQNSVRVYGAL